MKIYCVYDRLVPVAELDQKRHPKNPNTHSAAQVAAIAAVLEGNGWRQAIVISNQSGRITRGHGRLDAALLLGCHEAPVDFQDYTSEQDEIADMIADNRLSELSEIDENKLLDVLKELHSSGHDLELAGFTDEDFEKLANVAEEIANAQPIPKMELQAFEHYDYLMFMFKDIRDWLRVLQLLNVTKVDFSISRKTQKIGIGRVINGKTLLTRLEDSPRHYVAGAQPTGDDAPVVAAGDVGSAD
ncbi:MAG TPA: ParB N-terminal domain-containing protein [Verrucomicrobiae bacterium]|nr:ParB N-terminal domain-containing protein [Verrucomicrobiae bacterium]